MAQNVYDRFLNKFFNIPFVIICINERNSFCLILDNLSVFIFVCRVERAQRNNTNRLGLFFVFARNYTSTYLGEGLKKQAEVCTIFILKP